MPINGPMPDELRTYRLLKLGLSLTDIDAAPVARLNQLLELDDIFKEKRPSG